MGAAASTANVPPVELTICVEGETPFGTSVSGKWANQSLLSVVIVPFLNNLQKEGRDANLYNPKMLAAVTVAGTPLSIHNEKQGGPPSIYCSVAEIYLNVGGGEFFGRTLPVVLSMHNDDEKARPGFISRMVSGDSLTFKIYLGSDILFSTELPGKWLQKPAREALVEPFLENFNASSRNKGQPLQPSEIDGLKVDGVVEPTGAAALDAPAKTFAPPKGGTVHVHLIVNASRSAEYPFEPQRSLRTKPQQQQQQQQQQQPVEQRSEGGGPAAAETSQCAGSSSDHASMAGTRAEVEEPPSSLSTAAVGSGKMKLQPLENAPLLPALEKVPTWDEEFDEIKFTVC